MNCRNAFRKALGRPPLLLLAALCLTAGCTGGQEYPRYVASTGGNASEGKKVIEQKGCGACHTIPGIYTARGTVGPPLFFFSRRTIIAGELPNTTANVIRWIENPPAINPKTAMPNLGLTDQEARDVAAYLSTLH